MKHYDVYRRFFKQRSQKSTLPSMSAIKAYPDVTLAREYEQIEWIYCNS